MTDRFDIAGRWLLRLQADDIQEEDFSSWLAWYEADPANRAAFEEARTAFESARGLADDERMQFARRLMATKPPRFQWLRQLSPVSFAAGALAVAVVGLLLLLGPRAQQPSEVTATYQTPLATHRVERLPDGSAVHLGARSSISLSFSGETRYLVLESGEALFKVAKDATRPFVVQAGQVTVRALGTEFNVRRAGDSTTVAVKEGIVEVLREPAKPITSDPTITGDIRLEAGHLVAVSRLAETPTVKQINVAAVSAWEVGRLEFFNEPLPLVVATVNRYSSREIVVTDPSLSKFHVTGSIDGRHISEWLRALPDIFPVKVDEIGKATVLLSPS